MRFISFALVLLAVTAIFLCNASTVRADGPVTWTNLVSANASGSSLTPTAAGGHAESSQTITSGNGSLVVSAWPSYPDGNWASFGLTNGTFTGDRAQIKYGWLTYGSVANCRVNGESLNNLITIAQGDTLEVRINGTTVEWYHNGGPNPVWSLPNQTLSYPYRAAATFSASTSPVISSATMTGTGGGSGPSIKTDRAVYPEPPLPTLPSAGGKFTDPVFGTEIMRATDASDYAAPGCGTYYNQWPTFNSNNTRILIRCGVSGDVIIKAFDPVNFTLGTTLRKTFGGGATQIPTIGGEYAQWQGATWSRNDPDKIWVVPGAPNAGGSTNKGPQIYTYSVSANTYTPVKSFVSLFAAGQVFFEYHFAGTASDGDYDVFTASVNPEQNDGAARWFAWQRTGDRVVFNFDNANVTHYNICLPSKGGDYILCSPNFGYTNRKIYRVSDLAEQDFSSGPLSVHGDLGTVWTVARNVQGTNMPQERRTISNWHNTALPIFDWKDANGIQDASNDCHTSLAADNENWVMEGCYDDPNYDTPGNPAETGAFEDEVIQISMDGSQRIRRLLHHRSEVKNTTAINGYWAIPKATISRDGRFIAYTSNWEESGRYDLFIARIVPAQ